MSVTWKLLPGPTAKRAGLRVPSPTRGWKSRRCAEEAYTIPQEVGDDRLRARMRRGRA